MTVEESWLDEDSNEDEEREAPNKNFAELRKAYNRAEKERKALAAEIEELRTFRAEITERETQARVQSVFEEVGLNPAHAKLFKALNPDVGPDGVTAEAVAAFASEYQLVTTSGEPVSEPEPKTEGFKPVATPSGSGTGPAVMSLDDAKQLIHEGRYDEVNKLYQEGRVERMERDANGAPVVDWLEGMR